MIQFGVSSVKLVKPICERTSCKQGTMTVSNSWWINEVIYRNRHIAQKKVAHTIICLLFFLFQGVVRWLSLGKKDFRVWVRKVKCNCKIEGHSPKVFAIWKGEKKNPLMLSKQNKHTQTWWKHFFSSLTYILKPVIMFCDILLGKHFPILSYEQILYQTQLQWEILIICFTLLPHLLSKLEDSITKQILWISTNSFCFPKLCAPDSSMQRKVFKLCKVVFFATVSPST